jgi:hypothetical protein
VRGALTLAVWLGLVFAASAQDDATLSAEVDARQVGVEDQLQLTITLHGRSIDLAGAIVPPSLKNLRVAGGPFTSTQISFVNGAISQSRTETYVLQPVALGKAEVGAVHARLKNGVDKVTQPIAVEVVAGQRRPAPARRPDPFGMDPDPFGADPFDGLLGRRRPQPAPRLRVEAVASRQRVHVGEALLLTYYLYTQVSVSDVRSPEPPKYPGFWSEEIPRSQAGVRAEIASLEGERYQRLPLFQKLLFPTKSGRLTVPAATLRIALAGRGFFDAGPSLVERQTKPITIDVQPIPESSGFSGAVGQFKASARIDRSAVALGEAVTLRFTLSGRGNLRWIEKGPDLQLVGAKVFPPQVTDDVKVDVSGMSGARTWEYVVVPETAGMLVVPALTLAYFDPGAGRVAEAESTPLTIEVRAGSGSAGSGAPAPMRAALLTSASGGGLPLRSDLERTRLASSDLKLRSLMALLSGVLGVHVLLLGVAGWRARPGNRPGRGPARVSVRSALAEVRRAEQRSMSKEAAAAVIEKALTDVFGDLAERTPGAERDAAARAVLDEVRFLRYAPQLGDYSEKIREVAARAADAIRRRA